MNFMKSFFKFKLKRLLAKLNEIRDEIYKTEQYMDELIITSNFIEQDIRDTKDKLGKIGEEDEQSRD